MFKSGEHASTETIIGPSVHVQGDLSSQGNVHIEGTVTGTVTTSGNLTVGEGAQISANVQAANAYIAGRVKGNLAVAERLELAATSRVTGDVATKVLVVADGALLDGRCQMKNSAAAQATGGVKPSSKRAGAAAGEPAA